MWDWADQNLMFQEDLKSLDIFSFGLTWAGVLARRSVIRARDGYEPDMLRLLEIFHRIETPSEEDLMELGYKGIALDFACAVLNDDNDALRSTVRWHPHRNWDTNTHYNACLRELDVTPRRLGTWVRQNACDKNLERYLPESSQAPGIIEDITRFSYLKRPSVQNIIRLPYFEQFREITPEQVLELPKVECCFADAGAELDKQFAGIGPREDPRRRRNRKMRAHLDFAHEVHS